MMDKVREALKRAHDAIRSLPEVALGYAHDAHGEVMWPLRDELANDLKEALTALQGAGEPVAWRCRIVPHIAPRWVYSEEKPTWPDAEIQTAFDKNGVHFEAQPLYTTPPSPAAIRREERERCAHLVETLDEGARGGLAGVCYRKTAAAIRSLPDQPPAESSPGDAGESAKQPPPLEGEVVEALRCAREKCLNAITEVEDNLDIMSVNKKRLIEREKKDLALLDRALAALSQPKGGEG